LAARQYALINASSFSDSAVAIVAFSRVIELRVTPTRRNGHAHQSSRHIRLLFDL
jgi:hypothetical protein